MNRPDIGGSREPPDDRDPPWMIVGVVLAGVAMVVAVVGWALTAEGDETLAQHTHTYTDSVTRRIAKVEHKTFYSKKERPWCDVEQFDVQYTCDDQDNPYISQWGVYLGHRTKVHVAWSCSAGGNSKDYSKTYDFPGGGGYNKGTHSWSSFSIPAVPAGWDNPCKWVVTHTAPTTTTTTTTTLPDEDPPPVSSTSTTTTSVPVSPCLGGWWFDGVDCQPPSRPTTTTTSFPAPLPGSWSGACAFTWRVGDTIVGGGLFDAGVVSSHGRFTGVRLPTYGGLRSYVFRGSVPSGMDWVMFGSADKLYAGSGVGVWGSPTAAGTWRGNLTYTVSYSSVGGVVSFAGYTTPCTFTVLGALAPGEGPVRACTAAVSEGVLEGVRGLVSWRTNFVPVDDGSGVDLEAAMRELGVVESPAFPSAWAAGGLGDPDDDFRVWPFWPPDRIGLADVVDTAECSWGARRVITRVWPRVMWREGDVATVREVRPNVASVWEGQDKRFRDRVRGEFEARWRRAGWSESVAVPSRGVPVGSVCDLLGRAGETAEELSGRLKLECFWWVPVEGVYSWETVVEYITSDHSDGIRRRGELVLYEGSGWIGGGHPGVIRIIPGGAFVR